MTDNEEWVLVRTARTYGDIRPYDAMPYETWKRVEDSKAHVWDWEEVARGTEEELRALVKLMPEARVMFD